MYAVCVHAHMNLHDSVCSCFRKQASQLPGLATPKQHPNKMRLRTRSMPARAHHPRGAAPCPKYRAVLQRRGAPGPTHLGSAAHQRCPRGAGCPPRSAPAARPAPCLLRHSWPRARGPRGRSLAASHAGRRCRGVMKTQIGECARHACK